MALYRPNGVIEMSCILRREEVTLLQRKYLPAVHKAYAKMVEDLARIAEKVADDDDGEIWLTEKQQRRLIRQLYRDWNGLASAGLELRDYLRDVLTRLEEPT